MKSNYAHIFDKSACLSGRQLKDYVAGNMLPEEVYAAEHHLNSCMLCSAAVDGALARPEEALEGIGELNSNFLTEHFKASSPQIHLNSVVGSATAFSEAEAAGPHPSRRIPLLRIVSVAAGILLIAGMFWYWKFADEPMVDTGHGEIASAAPEQPNNATLDRADAALAAAAEREEKEQASKKNSALAKADEEPQAKPKKESVRNAAKDKSVIAAAPAAASESAPESNSLSSTGQRRAVAGDDHANSTQQKEIAVADAPAPSYEAPRMNNTIAEKSGTDSRKKAAASTSKKKAVATEADVLDEADELAQQGNHKGAITQYNKEMNSADKARRQRATIGAARSYISSGNTTKAQSLLQQIVDEGGPEKGEAKRLLRTLKRKE